MSGPLVPSGDGQTALTDEDLAGLKPAWIRTRGDLNGAEQENILKAQANRRQPTVAELLTDTYLRGLHKAMFGDVWTWAGTYRTTNPNLGCDWQHIAVNVRVLLDNVAYWVQEGSYPPEETAARFHHHLVSIHPFPNGNGRHTRLAAGYLATALGVGPLTWGAGLGLPPDELRKRYINALLLADREGDISALLSFASS